MNYLFIINPIFAVYNYITDTSLKTLSTVAAIYRLCTTNPSWYILESGQFANSSDFHIFDTNSSWTYDGSVLSYNGSFNTKKLPYLSFEFTIGNDIINMDDFIENTRYLGPSPPPLTVIMAAFCIKTKTIYPWSKGKFNVFSKMGDQIEFSGSEGKFPDTQ